VASAAKVRVGQAAKFVGQQAVQLHGGMGVTDELLAAHHFKRLTMIGLTLGDVDHHLERFAHEPGFTAGQCLARGRRRSVGGNSSHLVAGAA